MTSSDKVNKTYWVPGELEGPIGGCCSHCSEHRSLGRQEGPDDIKNTENNPKAMESHC